MNFKHIIRQFLRNIGYDIVKYKSNSNPIMRRRKLLESYKITLVIDVGANVGQFGKQLRSLGYKGEIISFEPQKSAYDVLMINVKMIFCGRLTIVLLAAL